MQRIALNEYRGGSERNKVNEEIEIRFLDAADAADYSRIRLEMLESEPEAFSSSDVEHRNLSAAEIERRISLDPENKFVVGAFQNGRLLGAAGFLRNSGLKERHKGFIWGVYVAPAARGKGVGKSLMRALLDRAIAIAGVEQILISVSTTQKAAGCLYRALGFQSWGCERRALKVGEQYIDEEYMALYIERDKSCGM